MEHMSQALWRATAQTDTVPVPKGPIVSTVESFAIERIGDLANLATVLGVVAILIAWAVHRYTIAKDAKANMNQLFREFQRLEFDYYNTDKAIEKHPEAENRLFAYKMWVLEEAFEWQRGRGGAYLNPFRYLIRWWARQSIADWYSTIRSYLHVGRQDEFKRLIHYQDCFSPRFTRFALRHHIRSPLHQPCEEYCRRMAEADFNPGCVHRSPVDPGTGAIALRIDSIPISRSDRRALFARRCLSRMELEPADRDTAPVQLRERFLLEADWAGLRWFAMLFLRPGCFAKASDWVEAIKAAIVAQRGQGTLAARCARLVDRLRAWKAWN